MSIKSIRHCDVCKIAIPEAVNVSFSVFQGTAQYSNKPVLVESVYKDIDLCPQCCSEAFEKLLKGANGGQYKTILTVMGLQQIGTIRRERDELEKEKEGKALDETINS